MTNILLRNISHYVKILARIEHYRHMSVERLEPAVSKKSSAEVPELIIPNVLRAVAPELRLILALAILAANDQGRISTQECRLTLEAYNRLYVAGYYTTICNKRRLNAPIWPQAKSEMVALSDFVSHPSNAEAVAALRQAYEVELAAKTRVAEKTMSRAFPRHFEARYGKAEGR